MSSREATERVLDALTAELRASRRIGEIEAKVGRSRGYFSKVAAGKWRISVDLLMETLEALDLDPAAFFARALAPETSPARAVDDGLRAADSSLDMSGNAGTDYFRLDVARRPVSVLDRYRFG